MAMAVVHVIYVIAMLNHFSLGMIMFARMALRHDVLVLTVVFDVGDEASAPS